MTHLGVELDPARNARHADRLSAARTAIDVLVVPAGEEIVIARLTGDRAAPAIAAGPPRG